ncbi:MAG TPA: ABC transporter permease [Acidimicrobiales bacterium]|nr:ABC transporter permease [Acidimicrobiales bacterium]
MTAGTFDVGAPGALTPSTGGAEMAPGSRLRWAFTDAVTVTWRNLVAYTRIPDAIFFSSIQPIMFVLLFRYVFGGAIQIPGTTYVNYLIAGVYVQTVMFGCVSTSVGLADDLHKGLIERFRALPMARSAVLAGRTTADALRNVVVLVIITAVGYLVGFRVQTNVGLFLCGLLLVLFFAYALGWGFAIIGLSASTSESAQLAAFPLLFPLTFASSAFVPTASMPGWLQAFAVNQPVSQLVNACRQLMLGTSPTHVWSPDAIWISVVWAVGILLVFAPLAVWRYRRVS